MPVKEVKWTSLLTSLPRNVGAYVPRYFDTVGINEVMVPSVKVIQARADYCLTTWLVFSSTPTHCIILLKNAVAVDGRLEAVFR